MPFKIDLKGKTVGFKLSPRFYSMDSLEVASSVFSRRAEASLEEQGNLWFVTLKSQDAAADAARLENLAGEFLNELLNQEYRKIVYGFNRNISNSIVIQALFSAKPPTAKSVPPAPSSGSTRRTAAGKLMERARREIQKTRPKKIPNAVK